MFKLLLIGPKVNKKNPKKTGGIIVLFEDLIAQLNKTHKNSLIIDTNKENYSNKIFSLILIYINIIKNIRNVSHVSLHGTANDFLFIGPFLILVSKVFNKKVSLRKFAGNYHKIFENYNFIFKFLINYTLRNSNQTFFETKELVSYFKKYNKNTFWFPNVRDLTQKKLIQKKFKKNFVFLSAVKETKGINEIIKAFSELPKEYSVHIYGPIMDKKLSINNIEVSDNISYKGPIESQYVIETLETYDVLLLPTYHEGEGYPGIIIEAFSIGIPSISTNWNAIPEIIVNNKNGILIEPRNYLELKDRIMSIEKNYKILSKNAFESFHNFSSEKQTKLFLERIEY